MKILIDDVKLNLLLETKKSFIGKNVAWDSFLSAFSFLISVLLASYRDFFGLPGIALKTVFVVLGVGFTFKSLADIHDSSKNNYSYSDLLSDINKLNEITHNHSFVIIKDTFNRYPNRLLVYDDTRWNCKFFLNYKENPNNESFIKQHISQELKIETFDITLDCLGQRIHEKFSESTHEEKVYSHRFYLAKISKFPDMMLQDSFECDGKQYYWMTVPELEQDENVQKKNNDILGYVKELV